MFFPNKSSPSLVSRPWTRAQRYMCWIYPNTHGNTFSVHVLYQSVQIQKANKPNHPTSQKLLIVSLILMEDNVSSKWLTAVTTVMINTKLQIRKLSPKFPKPHCCTDNSDWQMYSCGVLQTFSPSSSRRSSVVLSVFCSSSIAPDSSNSCSWSWLSSSAPSAVERDRFKGALTRPKTHTAHWVNPYNTLIILHAP